MSERKSRYITVEGKEIHFSQWGKSTNPAIICLHGLTRNGRDFDTLANQLSQSYYVICPDILGRGLSQWSTNPDEEYCFHFYEKLIVGLINTLGLEKLIWIGTSMGGALGIRAAGKQLKDRITHLILNDIGAGPTEEALKNSANAPSEGVQAILTYTANPPKFAAMTQLKNYYEQLYKAFGITSEEEWMSFTQNSVRRTDSGSFTPDYDPNIVKQFAHMTDLLLWDKWDQITAKVMVLRGELSDILPLDTVEEMTMRGPRFNLHEIAGVGHAPGLNTAEQIEMIEAFLKS
ncbi:MAG: alpha/beta hydrolase [Bacillota bacterium]|nr:alpha/beta hydrolase [Bacillota bacterium]MDP4171284.1 alpha/beta hydrolase [Bacillota bacterium]